MNAEFINLTPENLSDEHVCCIIRKNAHIGIDAKKNWLSERLFGGEFVTVNQIDGATAEKIIKKYSTSKHQISGK